MQIFAIYIVKLTVIVLDVVMLSVFDIDKMSSIVKRSSLLRHKSSMNASLNHFFRKNVFSEKVLNPFCGKVP